MPDGDAGEGVKVFLLELRDDLGWYAQRCGYGLGLTNVVGSMTCTLGQVIAREMAIEGSRG